MSLSDLVWRGEKKGWFDFLLSVFFLFQVSPWTFWQSQSWLFVVRKNPLELKVRSSWIHTELCPTTEYNKSTWGQSIYFPQLTAVGLWFGNGFMRLPMVIHPRRVPFPWLHPPRGANGFVLLVVPGAVLFMVGSPRSRRPFMKSYWTFGPPRQHLLMTPVVVAIETKV